MAQTAAQHGITAHTEGAWDAAPIQTRSERFTSAEVADFAEVSGLESVWKFTPVKELQDLFNSELDGSRDNISVDASAGVKVAWVPVATSNRGVAGLPEERGAANAWSRAEEVLEAHITGENQTLTLSRSALDKLPRAAHTVITAAPHASGIIVLRNTGDAQLSENVEIVLGDGADLTVVSVQQWSNDAKHLSSHYASVGRDASLKHIVVSLGGAVVRVNPSIHLNAEGGSIDALGAYFSTSGQHIEQQVYIDHDAPHTRSRVTYKGALRGEGARSVWIGDVLIRQSATGTDSYEQNRNLVLSDGTRADSIPNLEIETGDIAGAGHASATGRFDDEQLFYLMARGITEEEARRLVVRGFLLEVINQIGDESLEDELRVAIEEAIESDLSNS